MAILNITNFDDHPEDPMWMVFRFTERRIADEFVDGLSAVSIPFEQDESDEAPFLVGVKAHNREAAVRINYAVLGKHRSPFIADGLFRWSVIGLFAILLLMAVLGMVFEK
ncbi:MAG: hypothetical protein KA186_08500 [Flavobacteriales bacterium]|nr:hypothetical protein [Flavobacteriales bacterium]